MFEIEVKVEIIVHMFSLCLIIKKKNQKSEKRGFKRERFSSSNRISKRNENEKNIVGFYSLPFQGIKKQQKTPLLFFQLSYFNNNFLFF